MYFIYNLILHCKLMVIFIIDNNCKFILFISITFRLTYFFGELFIEDLYI
jgi:hypothetical protein